MRSATSWAIRVRARWTSAAESTWEVGNETAAERTGVTALAFGHCSSCPYGPHGTHFTVGRSRYRNRRARRARAPRRAEAAGSLVLGEQPLPGLLEGGELVVGQLGKRQVELVHRVDEDRRRRAPAARTCGRPAPRTRVPTPSRWRSGPPRRPARYSSKCRPARPRPRPRTSSACSGLQPLQKRPLLLGLGDVEEELDDGVPLRVRCRSKALMSSKRSATGARVRCRLAGVGRPSSSGWTRATSTSS